MPYVLVTPPTDEPVTLAEAKLHLRTDIDTEDALIKALIQAARYAAESKTQRQLVTATWKLVLDAFPGAWLGLMGAISDGSLLRKNAILLNKCPVQSVTSIRYMDMSGAWQTMPSTDYVVDLSTEPARITPLFGKIWPISQPQIGAVEITFVAGYGAPSDDLTVWSPAPVPEGIKAWMKLRIDSLHKNRGETIETQGKLEQMPYADYLLDPYTVANY